MKKILIVVHVNQLHVDLLQVCAKFSVNGDFASFCVYPIIINGDLDEGTEIDCNGDKSCAFGEI